MKYKVVPARRGNVYYLGHSLLGGRLPDSSLLPEPFSKQNTVIPLCRILKKARVSSGSEHENTVATSD